MDGDREGQNEENQNPYERATGWTPRTPPGAAGLRPAEPPPWPAPLAPLQDDQPPPPRRRRAKAVGAAAAILVVGGIVAGIVVATSGGGSSPRSGGPGSPAATAGAAPALGAPPSLSARAEVLRVRLSWAPPAGSREPQSYRVYRSGVLVGEVRAPTTDFVDLGAIPGIGYSYAVEAVSGEVVSPLTSTEVTTVVPPLGLARLQGVFDVSVKKVSSTGFTTYPKSFTLEWSFAPTCKRGACDVKWKQLAASSLSAVLHRAGTRYSGSDKGDFNGRCGKTHETSTLALSLRVTAASFLQGQWLATTIKGTLEEDEAAQLGCVATHASLSFGGTPAQL